MRNSRRFALPAVIAAAAVAGISGFSTAAVAASGNTEYFHIVDRNGEHGTVQAHGVFDRSGTDTSKNSSDVFRFGNGTLVVAHPASGITSESQSSDPSACRFTFAQSGTYWVKSGTGAYADASGHGHYTAAGSGVAQRNSDGSCNFAGEPKSEVVVVHAHGPFSFG